MSTLLDRAPTLAPTDPGVFTHMVNCPPDKESTEAWITEARVFGLVVTALCGHQWVPSRDPQRYPVCPECVEAANIIIADVNAGP